TLNEAKTGETTTSTSTTVALEIDMTALIASTTSGETTTTTADVKELADYVTIEYNLGAGLTGVTATHKGHAMVASDDVADDEGWGVYSYDSATGILTIKTDTLSPFEVTYKAKNLIPVGGTYYTGVTSTALGTYTGENVQAYVGDGATVEFPETVTCGDVYVYGDYEYRYQYYFGSISGFYAVNALEDGWHLNSEDAKWYARVLDKTKTSYGPLLEAINGEELNGLTHTFLNCTNLVVAPDLPDTVYALEQTFFGCTALTTVPHLPVHGTVMSATFKGCTSLVDAPALPEAVVSMISTFHSCTSLANAPALPEGLQDLTLAFYGTAITSAPALPSTARNIQFAFRGCSALTSLEDSGDGYLLPEGLTNIQGAFYDCAALSGQIVINAEPTSYTGCFMHCGADENHAITLSGSSSLLSSIAATGGAFVTAA
ncbi:MAG: leucine-rich repeat protein, partial [Clostridia bacterium]|nr:leucine-rich repeat protein [Clostridia bacterium]